MILHCTDIKMPGILAALLLSLALTVCAALAPAHARPSSVCIVNSYSRQFSWTRDLDQALMDALKDKAAFTVFDMDTKNVPEERFAARAEAALAFCRQAEPDLFVLTDDNAMRLLGQRLVDAGERVLYLGVNDNPRTYLKDPRTATGVMERPLFKRSILLARRVLGPDATRGLVLFDDSVTSKVLHKDEFEGLAQYNVSDLAMDYKATNSLEAWRDALLRARENGYSFVALGLHHTLRNLQGTHEDPDAAMDWARRNSSVPLFGFWDFDIGPGKTLGGVVLTGTSHGRIAAALARRLLDGEPTQTVEPVHDRQGVIMFSRTELRHWDITLPDLIRRKAVFTP